MAKANSTNAGLIPAVGYVRMSDDRQEASPDQQRGEIIRLAERLGYRIVRWYVDNGISGDATERRLDFLRMRQDIELGDFQAVLCWDQDRFGRFDPIEGGYWIKPFRDAGIKLVTVAQGVIDWTDFQGRLMYIIQQEGKHAYLRDLSRNVLRGGRDGALRGEWQGGPAPYGFMTEEMPGVPMRKNGTRPKWLVPHPVHGPIVQRIFDMYGNQGMSLREVAETLNDEGIPSPGGKLWRFSLIRRYLTDDVYIGTYSWGKNPDGKYNHVDADGQIVSGPNRRKARGYRDNPDCTSIPNAHEPLVSVEVFERCQQWLVERKGNRSPYKSKKNPYVLAGLCKCGHCKGGLIGQVKCYRKWTNRIYMCATYNQSGNAACQRYYFHEQPMVDCLIRKLQDEFLNPANLRKLRAEIRRQCKASKPACKTTDIKRLRRRIDKLTQDIDQGAQRLLTAPDDLTDVLTDTLRQWRTERDELQRQLKAAEMPHNVPEGEVAEMVDRAIAELQSLRERLHETNPAILRDVLRQLVDRVDLYFTRTKGKQKCHVRKGKIHLRPDLQLVRIVSSLCTGASTEG